jgi:hypothetical protein
MIVMNAPIKIIIEETEGPKLPIIFDTIYMHPIAGYLYYLGEKFKQVTLLCRGNKKQR